MRKPKRGLPKGKTNNPNGQPKKDVKKISRNIKIEDALWHKIRGNKSGFTREAIIEKLVKVLA